MLFGTKTAALFRQAPEEAAVCPSPSVSLVLSKDRSHLSPRQVGEQGLFAGTTAEAPQKCCI